MSTQDIYNLTTLQREKAIIWDLVRSPFSSASLCNDTFKWFAVNIPLNLVDKTQPQGDIDILVNMIVFKPKNGKEDFQNIYRCFEVKTSKVANNHDIKSLKENKNRKIKAQLKKIKKFGANQIFLLWAFLFEEGYSLKNKNFPQILFTNIKYNLFNTITEDFGYEVFFLEKGIFHTNLNVGPAKIFTPKNPFNQIVEVIELFHSKENISCEFGFGIITFCEKCKKLVSVCGYGIPKCPKCSRTFY